MKKVKKLLKKLFSTNATSPKTLFLLISKNNDNLHYYVKAMSENSNQLYQEVNFDKNEEVVTMKEFIQLQKETYKK